MPLCARLALAVLLAVPAACGTGGPPGSPESPTGAPAPAAVTECVVVAPDGTRRALAAVDLTVFEAWGRARRAGWIDGPAGTAVLRRPAAPEPLEVTIDLAAIVATGDTTTNVLLQPGDELEFLPPAGAGGDGAVTDDAGSPR